MSAHYVLVLAGGPSYERDVSFSSGQRMLEALNSQGYEAVLCDVDSYLIPRLINDPPDAAVLALHGAAGEDGTIRTVLDLYRIPYVGTDSYGARLCWDKAATKARLKAAGINTPQWITLTPDTFRDLGSEQLVSALVASFGLPLVVKPARGGSGLGLRIVEKESELTAALMYCFSYDSTALLEQYINGVDIAVSIVDGLGNVGQSRKPHPLPCVEIDPLFGSYDYAARYSTGKSTWHVPARLSTEVGILVEELAIKVHRILNLRDLSRVDIMVDSNGEAYVLEAEVSPGMTETSLFPLAGRTAGYKLGDILSKLVQHAIERAQ